MTDQGKWEALGRLRDYAASKGYEMAGAQVKISGVTIDLAGYLMKGLSEKSIRSWLDLIAAIVEVTTVERTM